MTNDYDDYPDEAMTIIILLNNVNINIFTRLALYHGQGRNRMRLKVKIEHISKFGRGSASIQIMIHCRNKSFLASDKNRT